MKKIVYLFALIFILYGCADTSKNSGNIIISKSITIKGESRVALNHNVTYEAILYPNNFTNENVVWSVDNSSVGKIDKDTGVFTALSKGTTNIKATAGSVDSQNFPVTVYVPVESISVSDTSPRTVNIGESAIFTANINPIDADYEKLVWNVDNTEIANINQETGVLVGNKNGIVNVTVAAGNIKSNNYEVQVVTPVESISIDGPESLPYNTKQKYSYTIKPEEIDTKQPIWSVDNESIAIVDNITGEVTTKAVTGQFTLSVNVNNINASKIIGVAEKPVIKGNNSTGIGGHIILSTQNDIPDTAIWSSDNTNIATVKNGIVTGVSAGNANITVSIYGQTSEPFKITVKDIPNGYEIINGAYHVYNISGYRAWETAVLKQNTTSCYLQSDLDFTGEVNNTLKAAFKGTFNGNNHIIKNFTILNGNSIVKTVESSGQFINVIYDNASISYNTFDTNLGPSAGMITIRNDNLIKNIEIRNSTFTVNTGNSNYEIGFIAGTNFGDDWQSSKIENCRVINSNLTVTGKMSNVGGIVGKNDYGSQVIGSLVKDVSILAHGVNSGTGGVGGIAGKLNYSEGDNIVGCGVINTTITNNSPGKATYEYVGGIYGVRGLESFKGQAVASFFTGSITHKKPENSGLDFGKGSGSSIYVKRFDGPTENVIDTSNSKIVDNVTVTWADAVKDMNNFLTTNNFNSFKFTYLDGANNPEIEYLK